MLLKTLLTSLASALSLGSASVSSAQEAWPSRPMRITVPFPAGGSSDPPVRALAAKLQENLGQSVVIENVSGGGGSIAQWPFDGYTDAMASVGTLCIVTHLQTQVGHDPLRSFSPVTLLGEYTNVLVVPPVAQWGAIVKASGARAD